MSVNHVSMRTKDIESSKEVRKPSNRDLAAAMEDLQRS